MLHVPRKLVSHVRTMHAQKAVQLTMVHSTHRCIQEHCCSRSHITSSLQNTINVLPAPLDSTSCDIADALLGLVLVLGNEVSASGNGRVGSLMLVLTILIPTQDFRMLLDVCGPLCPAQLIVWASVACHSPDAAHQPEASGLPVQQLGLALACGQSTAGVVAGA